MKNSDIFAFVVSIQCFDAVGRTTGKASIL